MKLFITPLSRSMVRLVFPVTPWVAWCTRCRSAPAVTMLVVFSVVLVVTLTRSGVAESARLPPTGGIFPELKPPGREDSTLVKGPITCPPRVGKRGTSHYTSTNRVGHGSVRPTGKGTPREGGPPPVEDNGIEKSLSYLRFPWRGVS